MNLYSTIFFIMGLSLSVFAIERTMGIFFEQRKTSLQIMVISYFFAFVMFTINSILRTSLVIHILITWSLLLILSLNYRSSIIKRVTAVSCVYLLLLVIGNFSYVLRILPWPYWTLGTVSWMVEGLVLYLTAMLFRRRFKYIRKSTTDSPTFWIPSLLMANISSVLLLLVSTGTVIHLPVVWWFSLLALAVFFLSSFMSFYLYDTITAAYDARMKSVMHSKESEYYFSQCQLMQESVEQMKSIRHDIKLHLTTIKGYSTKIKADEITDYVSKLLGDIEESEVYSDTGNIAFDSIINFKLNKVKEENIKLDIHLLIPHAINVEVVDIVTILGNLLDNALDAVKKVEDRMIKLDIEFSRESLFIQVDNTFDGVVNYAEGKDGNEKHMVTRKDGDKHGHGLKNIYRSVEKYDGCVDITHEGNVFSVAVVLYVETV